MDIFWNYTFRKDGLATCSTVSQNLSAVEGYLLVKHPSVSIIQGTARCGGSMLLPYMPLRRKGHE